MGLISLTDMHFYAYHGVYEEEQIIGNDYWIDLDITTNIAKAGATDELGDTINYETVYLICKSEMKQRRRLLETIGNAIIQRLKYQFSTIAEVQIVIKKQNPPLGGKVGYASVSMDASYASKCGRCKKGNICYGDENCWCQNMNIQPQTLETLQSQYDGCLCKNCLSLYANK